MIDLDLASTELDGPGFLRVVAVDLVNLAIWLLTDIRHFEPIFHLEVAIALLDDSSEPSFRPIDGDDGGEDEDDETTVIRTSAAQTINDAILVLKAIGEGQPIPHLKEAFATLPGAILARRRSSYLRDILVDYPVPFVETLVTAAEHRWALIH